MSLMSLSQDQNREQDEMFLEQPADLAASESRPDDETFETSSSGEPNVSGAPEQTTDVVARHEQTVRRMTAARNAPVEDETERFLEDLEELDETAPAAQRPVEVEPDPEPSETSGPRVKVPPAPTDTAPAQPGDEDDPDASETLAVPAGVPKTASGVNLTEQEQVAALAEKMRGSIGDAGSVEDFINGLPARPSVASQKEIREFERRMIGGLQLNIPANWPEFMMIPTYEELRRLNHEGVTPEFIRNWEEEKQLQADAMETRAQELNDWIFSFGDGTLNEKQRVARMKNREEAMNKRSAGKDGKKNKNNRPDPQEITDEELYKDRHYGIRFATLLNPSPDHLNQLQKAPVASWGHDTVRTLDGGRVCVSGDEIRALTVTGQAAQLMVMEAKARGWETLRISGDNEFCAAVKRACKEQGMGAIITRRGPLGLGPFSKPEYIMPRLPDSLGPQMPDPEQRRKQQAAPSDDKEAADKLLGEGEVAGQRGRSPDPSGKKRGETPDRDQDPSDEVVEKGAADPARPDLKARPDQDETPGPDASGDETAKEPRPERSGQKIRLDEVDVKEVFTSEDRYDLSSDHDLTPIQRL
jgi:hypothetical protein